MKIKRLLFVFTLVLLFGITNAAADEWIAPTPFQIQSDDGSRFFYFNPDSDDSNERAVLYDNSNPPKVIYTVKGIRSWAYKSDFYFSEDFQNFVFFPPTGFDIAFEFYKNGVLHETYHIEDLVKESGLIPKSTTKAWWLSSDEKISQMQNILTFKTVDGITYNFNIASGTFADMDGRTMTFLGKSRLILIFAFIAICIAGIISFMLIRYKRKSGSSERKIPGQSEQQEML